MATFITTLFVAAKVIPIAFVGDGCGVVPIEHWSGQTSRRTETLHTPVDIVVVQHTVSLTCHMDSFCEATVRNIRDYHMVRFLISSHGQVYEGAGWHLARAHTRGYNAKAIGISFIGDFECLMPPPEALRAAQRLYECGVKNNYLSEDYRLVGHRQLSNTSSPGDRLQNIIKTWTHRTEMLREVFHDYFLVLIHKFKILIFYVKIYLLSEL